MKVSVEIKEDKIFYDYAVGQNTEHGEMPVNFTGLDLLCSIIQHCHRVHAYDTAKEIKEIECMAYIEKHPELIKKYNQRK
jgi:hypothetical protein